MCDKAVESLIHDFELDTDKLKRIAKHLRTEMDKGLQEDKANVPMLPSWICSHPTGQETGVYIGLELSG